MCNETLRHEMNMEGQEVIHSGKHIFMCDVCNKSFQNKYLLKLHVAKHSE